MVTHTTETLMQRVVSFEKILQYTLISNLDHLIPTSFFRLSKTNNIDSELSLSLWLNFVYQFLFCDVEGVKKQCIPTIKRHEGGRNRSRKTETASTTDFFDYRQ